MIKNLVFDFGKVLVDYDFMPVIDRFFGSREEDKRIYCGLLLTDEFTDKCDKEDVPFLTLIRQMQAAYPQYNHEFQLFYDHYGDFVIGEVEGMPDLLAALKEQGYRLYGLTNWCHKVHDVMRRYPVFRLLDGRVISSEEHLIKPDVAIYRRLCDKYGLEPAECLFVDDKLKNVTGAKAAGMHALPFTGAGQLRCDLKQQFQIEVP